MLVKLIKFNMPFTIAASQLLWSRHALERKQQRGVVMPRGITTWDFVDYRWNEGHDLPAMVLRHRASDVVIVVTKDRGLYRVITCYMGGVTAKMAG